MLNLKQYSLVAHIGAIIVAIAVQAVAFVVFWRAYLIQAFAFPSQITIHPIVTVLVGYVLLCIASYAAYKYINRRNALLLFYVLISSIVMLAYTALVFSLGIEWPMNILVW